MPRTTRAPGSFRIAFARGARRGMTLIEILVSLSIVAVLMALTAAALGKIREGAAYSRTSESVYKLQKAVDEEYDRRSKAARDETPDPELVVFCDGNTDRAKVVNLAIQQRRYFPQTFAEANSYVLVTTDSAG